MPVRRLVGDLAPPQPQRIGWIADMYEPRKRIKHVRAGYLFGNPQNEEWSGYLEVRKGLRVNLKGHFSWNYDRMLELEFLHDDWNPAQQLVPRTGTKTFRGMIRYPGYVRDALANEDWDFQSEGEWYSFYYHSTSQQLEDRQQIALSITRGGGPRRGNTNPRW